MSIDKPNDESSDESSDESNDESKSSINWVPVLDEIKFVPAHMSVPRSSDSDNNMDVSDELEQVKQQTSEVTAKEARDKHVGRIVGCLNFENQLNEQCVRVTGTLIHPRLVLTCAHFLKSERIIQYPMIVDTDINRAMNHFLKFKIDPISDALIVTKILHKSPFKETDLQVGDVIKKFVCKTWSSNRILRTIKCNQPAIEFEKKINNVCTQKNVGKRIWQWFIERRDVCTKFFFSKVNIPFLLHAYLELLQVVCCVSTWVWMIENH